MGSEMCIRDRVEARQRRLHHDAARAYAVLTQSPEMHGPPMYFTPDWDSARQSVRTLAALKPDVVVTGHGQAMRGPRMQAALEELAARFDDVAIPNHRRPA